MDLRKSQVTMEICVFHSLALVHFGCVPDRIETRLTASLFSIIPNRHTGGYFVRWANAVSYDHGRDRHKTFQDL